MRAAYRCVVFGTATRIVVAPAMTWLFVRIRPDEVSTMPVPAAHVSSRRRFVLMTTTPAPMDELLARVAARAALPPVAASATKRRARLLIRRVGMEIRSARPPRDLRAVAPGGVEPPRTDSKSVALSAELRGPAQGWRMGLEPTTTWTTTRGSTN